MHRLNLDIVAVFVIFGICALGVLGLADAEPAPPGGFGSASFPHLILCALGLCGLALLFQSLRAKTATRYWDNPFVAKKIFTYLGIFFLYIILMICIHLGIEEFADSFPFRYNTGFFISTVIFVYYSMKYMNRTNKKELFFIPIATASAGIFIFGQLFGVLLP